MIRRFIILFSIILIFGVPAVIAVGHEERDVVDYRLPIAGTISVTQEPGGKFSHCFENYSAQAWDLTTTGSQSVSAVAKGTVILIYEKNGNVKIKHDDDYTSSYTHMSNILVKKDQEVKQGEQLGTIGAVGSPGVYHLHFSFFSGDTGNIPVKTSLVSSFIYNTFSTAKKIPPGVPLQDDVCGVRSCLEKIDGPRYDKNFCEGIKRGVNGSIMNQGLKFCAERIEANFNNKNIVVPDYCTPLMKRFSKIDGATGEISVGVKADGAPVVPLNPIALGPIADMVNEFYAWALGIGAGVASGIIIYGGVLYILAAGSDSRLKESKEWIRSAIFGLVLLLLSYVLLNWINPSLVGRAPPSAPPPTMNIFRY